LMAERPFFGPFLEDSARFAIQFSHLSISEQHFFFTEQGRQPCGQHPTWRNRSPCLCPQWQGDAVIPPGTGFPFRRLLRLAGLWWRCSNPLPDGVVMFHYTEMKTNFV
jgi:hypothetical protein